MNILTKMEKKAKKAAEQVLFDLEYISGVTEDLDQYKASNEILGVCCYGSSQENAISSAKTEAVAIFMGQMSLADEVLRSLPKT